MGSIPRLGKWWIVLGVGVAVLGIFAADRLAWGYAWKILEARRQAWIAEMSETNPAEVNRTRPAQALSFLELAEYRAEYAALNQGVRYAYSTLYNMGPNFKGRYFSTDERGFRQVPPASDPDAPRVGFFGGSIVWGVETEFDRLTIPAQFQLQSEGRYQAVNYGMPSYNLTGSLLLFLSALVRDQPSRPLKAAIFYGMWNDCHSALWRIPGSKAAPPPHASDGLLLDASAVHQIFQRELEVNGKMVLDPPGLERAWDRLRSEALYLIRSSGLRLLTWTFLDSEYIPFLEYQRRKRDHETLSATDSEIDTALDQVINLNRDQMAAIRAVAARRGIKVLFAMPPMAFTRADPRDGEFEPSDYQARLLASCYAKAREAFGNDPDFVDLSKMTFPPIRVFADYGHMVGGGNQYVANVLLYLTEQLLGTAP